MATATLPLCDDTLDAESAAAAEAAAGRALRFQITATLVGATLLVCSLVAQVLWKTEFHAAVPAALAVLLLGAPLVWAAITDLVKGEAGMNALVALAVVGAAATGRYQESAAIALFMIVSGLIEKRTAIGAQAKQGLDKFMNYGCAGCHGGVVVGGRRAEAVSETTVSSGRPQTRIRWRDAGFAAKLDETGRTVWSASFLAAAVGSGADHDDDDDDHDDDRDRENRRRQCFASVRGA